MKSLEFVGSEICEVENGFKFKLPSAWLDTDLFKRTIFYERISYLDKKGNDITYFNFYPDSTVDGGTHSGKYLTRINDEGYIILPIEARNNNALGEFVFLIGQCDHIEMRFEKPTDFNDSFYEEVSRFLDLFGE